VISVALVGCAHIHTPRFIDMLLAREDVRVKVVWDRDAARAERTASRLHASVAPHLESIWRDEEIRAVVINSETAQHRHLVLPAVRAGKDLFVEKPLAIGGQEAWELAEAIEAAGLIFSTGYFLRGLAAHRFLRDEIAAGRFGRISRIAVSVTHAGALAGWFDAEWRWMADPVLAGFGALGDLGSHGLDLVLWLLGHRVEVVRVAAWTGSLTGRYGDIDECGQALLALSDGSSASLWASWIDRADPIGLVVTGTHAQAYVQGGRLSYRRAAAETDREASWQALPPELSTDRPHAFELFLDAIASGDGGDLVTPGQAARCSSLVEALYRAAAERAWVPTTAAAPIVLPGRVRLG
jgi:predicted dehydrogenase